MSPVQQSHEGRARFKDRKDEDDQVAFEVEPYFREGERRGELRKKILVEAIGDVMRRCRLKWHGQAERKTRFMVAGTAPIGTALKSVMMMR